MVLLQLAAKVEISASTKQNVIVSIHRGGNTGIGEAAPNIRYGEVADEVALEITTALYNCPSLSSVKEIVLNSELHACSRMAIDMALMNLRTQSRVSSQYAISYTIPVMGESEIRDFFIRERLQRFSSLKLKLSKNNWPHALYELQRLYKGNILLDANEAFQDWSVLADPLLKNSNGVKLIEQPFKAGNFEQNFKLKKALVQIPIIADEDLVVGISISDIAQAFGGINVKLQKAGSFKQAKEWITSARKADLVIMLGCMVETTLGISAALQLAQQADYLDLDSFLYLQKDPFNLLSEKEGQIF